MNTTTTHDTKRSEDVRARINVLSEIPHEWERRVARWFKWNAPHRQMISGHPVPDRNEEFFLYQTLLGMWPQDEGGRVSLVERLQAYAIKATREAMVHTRWTKPNEAHERALQGFIAAILKPGRKNSFLNDFLPFEKRIAYYGMVNGLAQTLLKIVSPGFPDFYQGSELWDLHLVDPDNRRRVDFARRKEFLAAMRQSAGNSSAAFLADLTSTWQDARIKLYLIWKALTFRRENANLISGGDFVELKVAGQRSENVAVFARRNKEGWLIAIAPRWLSRPGNEATTAGDPKFWGGTEIHLPAKAPRFWRNVLTGEILPHANGRPKRVIAVAQALQLFPVALLHASDSLSAARKQNQTTRRPRRITRKPA